MYMVLIWVGRPYLGPPPLELSGGGRYVGALVGGLVKMGVACRASLPSE